MKRFITEKLFEWKNQTNRKPLILKGARQVGKTWIVNDFEKNYFNGRVHVVNFEKHPDWHAIFELNFDVKRIVSELEVVLNTKIVTGEDLLFFDEIQSCPRAIMTLRYFYEDLPGQHIISEWALLEFVFRDIPVLVGRIRFLNMLPLSFPEFLLATGKPGFAEIIMSRPEKLSDTIHQSLVNELRHYFFVEGMPECVEIFSGPEVCEMLSKCRLTWLIHSDRIFKSMPLMQISVPEYCFLICCKKYWQANKVFTFII